MRCLKRLACGEISRSAGRNLQRNAAEVKRTDSLSH
jgi:hypothetical protein